MVLKKITYYGIKYVIFTNNDRPFRLSISSKSFLILHGEYFPKSVFSHLSRFSRHSCFSHLSHLSHFSRFSHLSHSHILTLLTSHFSLPRPHKPPAPLYSILIRNNSRINSGSQILKRIFPSQCNIQLLNNPSLHSHDMHYTDQSFRPRN